MEDLPHSFLGESQATQFQPQFHRSPRPPALRRRGDYLVESCDGVLSIAPRQIFEDIYVAMGLAPEPCSQTSAVSDETTDLNRGNLRLASLRIEPLRINKIKTGFRESSYDSVSLEKSQPKEDSPTDTRYSVQVGTDADNQVSRLQS